MIAIVVVLAPPAVEPELPPTIIYKIVKSVLDVLISPDGTTSKPAVLGVITENRLQSIFSPRGIFKRVLLYSNSKNKGVPMIVIVKVTKIEILECNLYCEKCHLLVTTSSQTKKPIEPIVIKAQIVKINRGSLLKSFKANEQYGEYFPSKSKPALQNADIDKNMALNRPSPKPIKGINLIDNSIAPIDSIIAVPKIIFLVSLTIPPIYIVFTLS